MYHVTAPSESEAYEKITSLFPDAGEYVLESRRTASGRFSQWGHHFYFVVLDQEIDLGEEGY